MRKNDFCDCDTIHHDVVELVRSKMTNDKTYEMRSEQLKVLSDVTRMKILSALSINKMCVCDIASLLNMTKSAISHQLKKLKKYHLVRSEKAGNIAYYYSVSHAPIEIYEKLVAENDAFGILT